MDGDIVHIPSNKYPKRMNDRNQEDSTKNERTTDNQKRARKRIEMEPEERARWKERTEGRKGDPIQVAQESEIDLRNGDFFLDRPNQFRGEGAKEAEEWSKVPLVESDLEEGRCFHMGRVREMAGREKERGESGRKKEEKWGLGEILGDSGRGRQY